MFLLFTQSLGMPLYKGDSSYRMKSFGLFHCLISFVLNQLAIEGKASLRYREDDGRGRESGLNRTAKMRGLEELAETDKVLTVTSLARQHNLTVFQNIGKRRLARRQTGMRTNHIILCPAIPIVALHRLSLHQQNGNGKEVWLVGNAEQNQPHPSPAHPSASDNAQNC